MSNNIIATGREDSYFLKGKTWTTSLLIDSDYSVEQEVRVVRALQKLTVYEFL